MVVPQLPINDRSCHKSPWHEFRRETPTHGKILRFGRVGPVGPPRHIAPNNPSLVEVRHQRERFLIPGDLWKMQPIMENSLITRNMDVEILSDLISLLQFVHCRHLPMYIQFIAIFEYRMQGHKHLHQQQQSLPLHKNQHILFNEGYFQDWGSICHHGGICWTWKFAPEPLCSFLSKSSAHEQILPAAWWSHWPPWHQRSPGGGIEFEFSRTLNMYPPWN